MAESDNGGSRSMGSRWKDSWIADKGLAIPAAVLAIIGLWVTFGFPTLATSSDINRLDRNQAAQAVELYQASIRSLMILSPQIAISNDGYAKAAHEEEMRRTRDKLQQAERQLLRVSK